MLIGTGISTARDHIQATREAVERARLRIPKERINLAIVFCSVEFAHPVVFKTIHSLLGEIPLLGCSSLALICNQGIFKYGLGIMLFHIPEGVHFNHSFVNDISKKGALASGEELGEKLLYAFKEVRRNLSLIFCDGLMNNSSEFIFGLQEKLGRSFPVIGALASDNLSFERTYVYFNDAVYSDAACGVLFGGKFNFGLGIHHGWKPLGKPRRITKSQANIAYEIDGLPASEVYESYFAKDNAELKKDLKRITMFYPVGLRLPQEKEYLLRNVARIKDGALIFRGDVPQGSTIRLMIGTKESCLEATQRAIDDVKKNTAGRRIKFALVFEGASRYALLGRQIAKEREIIKNGFGKDVPVLGIFTYGEHAPLGAINYLGKTYLHSQTITIVGFAE